MEDINNLDEAKLLGYFETIRSVFIVKFIFLVSNVSEGHGHRYIDTAKIPPDAIAAAKQEFEDPLVYGALESRNEELYHNVAEDLITALIGSSWNVFEQIIKDLTKADYATHAEDLSVTYQSGKFQFDVREKRDLDLFYYLRNAIYHFNGAYFRGKDIDHRFAGSDFKSTGRYGQKIEIKIPVAWKIALALERYTMKAWGKAKTFQAASMAQGSPPATSGP
jgi:hypothetical protein